MKAGWRHDLSVTSPVRLHENDQISRYWAFMLCYGILARDDSIISRTFERSRGFPKNIEVVDPWLITTGSCKVEESLL